jgi:predicted house-cleaning NTP pyrophosphatase (Maf/HAM1 superfamily)
LKYIVSYRTEFGEISAESKKPQDLVSAYSELKRIASKIKSKGTNPTKKSRIKDRREGRGETTAILRAIESRLLKTDFFSKPRTTGETGDQLSKISGKHFTSRKVSQALGILHEKKVLRRTGKRNFYAYTTA